MNTVHIEAHAKINWMLHIMGVRSNGYHELDMLMQTLHLHDDLTLTKADRLCLYTDGKEDDEADKNLIIKAVREVSKYTGIEMPVRADLIKRIPSRAGLGGGSADCAAAIEALDELYGLHLSLEQKCEIGLKLGADVPFFFYGGLCTVSGTGETVRKLETSPKYHIVISHVGGGLSTPEVYGKYDSMKGTFSTEAASKTAEFLTEGKINDAFENSHNDLEQPAIALLPDIAERIGEMKNHGCLAARMTGSGSAVYAVFEDYEKALNASMSIAKSIVTYTV